jgi:hypothetical protein
VAGVGVTEARRGVGIGLFEADAEAEAVVRSGVASTISASWDRVMTAGADDAGADSALRCADVSIRSLSGATKP